MPIANWIKNLRAIVGHDLIVMVGAVAIITDDDGNILLQQRSDNGKWGLPGGGVDPGEEPAETAIREAYEETGLQVEVVQLIGVFGGKAHVKSYPNGDQMAYVSITFECRIIGGEINPDPDETLQVAWFPMNDLPEKFSHHHIRRLHAFQTGNMPFFELPDNPILDNQSNYIRDMRQKVGHMLLMMSGATVLVFDDNGNLLVQQREDDNRWNLPGGVYEIGEEPAETAIREVYEETGFIVRPTRLVGVYGGESYRHIYPNGDEVAYINIVFVAEIVGGALNTQSSESTALCFVPPHQLPELFDDKHRVLIDHALNRTDVFFVR